MSGFVVGTWGVSIRTRVDVFFDVSRYLPATLELTIVSMIFAILVAVPLGVASAMNKDKWEDHVDRLLSLAGLSLPQFWSGIILQIVLASWLMLLPITGRLNMEMTPPVRITGMYLLDSLLTANWPVFSNASWHIVLPAFVLAFPQIANISRLTRTSMIEELNKDYTTLLKAYGMPRGIIQYKYMLKNAFNATLTIIALSFAYAFAGAVVVEAVFSWPGMGLYLVTSILWKDLNAITASVIVVGIAIVVVTFALEVLRGYLDPRIRFSEAR
jgi:peptide/nickel transport system permease protein